jgi:hypothetical protein
MKIPMGNGVVTNHRTSSGQVETQATSQALSNVSGVLGIVGKWKDQTDKTRVQEAINTATKKMNDWKTQNLTRTGKDAEGLTEDYLKFSQELEGELSSNLSNNAREMFNNWSFQATESDKMSVISHQHKQSQMVKTAAFEEGLTIAQETIRTDARQWPKAMEHMSNTLELGRQSGVIREEEFETKKIELTNRMRGELGKSYYTQDKHEFMKNIDQFGFGKPEIEAYKDKYQKDLAADERERKALYSEEAKMIMGQRDDMRAQAVANSDVSHFFNGAEKLEKMGYKEAAGTLREEGQMYSKVVEFQAEHRNKPLKEVVDAAKALEVSPDLDGSSIELKSRQAIQAEVQKRAKLFSADPAEFVKTWAVGETGEQIAASRLSLQESQGLYPSKGYQILTNEEKTGLKGVWESGDVKRKTGLVLEQFKYGKHTPKVLDEIGVNSALSLAPHFANNEKDVEMLVAGVAHRAEILDENQKSTYASANKGSNFYQHLVRVQEELPTNGILPEKIKDIDKAMTGISAANVDPNAGPKFFDERFETLDSGDKLVYFPKTVDEDEIETALDRKKSELLTSIKTQDSKQGLSTKWAMRDAKWINTTSGFALVDTKTGGMIPNSEVELVEIDSLRKDMIKDKMAKAQRSQDTLTRTFSRR